ncbi:MAG: Gfo/Idh/MocA family oxidoreductase [Oscillospiraceae bacterium]|nr:Gfo/Idh/MocA family oxidoreductase [Oscillospiraceae bacterium]
MTDIVRTALIGFGGMGKIYAQMIYAGMVPGMRLTGVCCRNAAGQKLLAEKFSSVVVYRDADDMAAHADDFDAVIIVTPHTSHISIGLQMAKLGKHILMDKPAGISAGEVRELTEYCDARNLAFGMIFNNRQMTVYRAAKAFLESGALGTLHRAVWVCNNWYRSPAYHASAGWRSSWNGECGGMLINQTPHNLDLWNWLFGQPDRVFADVEFGRYNDFQVEDAADIQLSWNNGFHGTFICATGEAPGVSRLEIWGSKGRLTVENDSLAFDENELSTEEFGTVNKEKFAQPAHSLHQIPLEEANNPYLEVFGNFARHLLHGEPLHADGWDGLREVELANAIYVSGWEEKKVTLPVAEERYFSGLQQRQAEEKR